MNIEKMNLETEKLKGTAPTAWAAVSCPFWASALHTFGRHLPPGHVQAHLYKNIWSVEAVESFKRCCPTSSLQTVSI